MEPFRTTVYILSILLIAYISKEVNIPFASVNNVVGLGFA